MNVVQPIRDLKKLKEMSNYLKKNKYMYYVLFQIGLYSGLRVSDILNLKVKDVENKSFIDVKEKKTSKIKRFPIKQELRKVIDDYIVLLKENYDFKKENYLFEGRYGGKRDRCSVYRRLNEAAVKVGITEPIGTHSMRKTFGYHNYKQFKDVALLQKIFNHSTPDITLRYIGINQEEINKCYTDFSYTKKKKQEKINIVDSDLYKRIEELNKKIDNLNDKIDKLLKKE